MRGGVGRGGSKKCKPIPAPPRGAGLKSHPIPAPPPLRGGENPHGAKRGGAGQAGRGKIAIPTWSFKIIWIKYILIPLIYRRGFKFNAVLLKLRLILRKKIKVSTCNHKPINSDIFKKILKNDIIWLF